MRRIYACMLAMAMIAGLWGCAAEQQPIPTQQSSTNAAHTQTQTQPATEETFEDKIGQQDTYWVASEWHSEDTGETQALQPDLWALDLMICCDGTARFRDIHERVCLVDDSQLTLTWERTEQGALLFFSRLHPQPVLRGTCEDGILYLDYQDVTLTMQEQDVPKEIGQTYTPAELVGTWLLVSGEVEGDQWEAMPDELSSLVFRVAAYDGPLELRADLERMDSYGEMIDAAHDQEVQILDEALYSGCDNGIWSVRIGPESAKDENGHPVETEIYATLLDYHTLLMQRYYTLDGAPTVSYQTYWRFPELVTWQAPEYLELEYSNWACTAYTNFQGEDRSPPDEMTDFSVLLGPDQTCYLYYGEETVLQGTWQIGNGGVLLLRSDDEAFWFGGVISTHCVETDYEVSNVYTLALYYNSGILRLEMTGYG